MAESYIRLSKVATVEKPFAIKKLGVLLAADTDAARAILRKILVL